MRKLKQPGVWLFILIAIGWGLGLAADETTDPGSATIMLDQLGLTGRNVMTFDSLTDAQLAAILKILDATPTILPSDLPENGTFWSLKDPNFPPFPGNFSGASAWQLQDGSFLLNDEGVTANVVKNGSRGSKTATGVGAFVAAVSGPPSLTNISTSAGATNWANVKYAAMFNTNLLWLQATNVLNGTVWVCADCRPPPRKRGNQSRFLKTPCIRV